MHLLQALNADVSLVQEQELAQEWGSLDLNVVLVDDIEQAIAHIRHYGTGHSESILTENIALGRQFIRQVDAAAVYLNASTRFTDGGQFGLGAEVAVSTQKLHARGPMGLEALTSYKWVCIGDYTSRA
ncbi:putative gamma-glutamyl phosphate reductase [Haemophilus pittmaniae HK 85]|uniref:Putative gamma-glutamyl phosphate reductase n=1 Tax=Haemophilus pittmaniae HK 85 TaxID=1035188 RepID=F9QAZ6_9PAST|nr:putative gamma-glutamyl phosphate reductase [Haemophilus pittmaniae HK 85]